jgi:hypothetical protein
LDISCRKHRMVPPNSREHALSWGFPRLEGQGPVGNNRSIQSAITQSLPRPETARGRVTSARQGQAGL